jgi:hypothetical protein
MAATCLALLAVLGLAVSLRAHGIADWSLWEDEETALYFSQHPDRSFPSYFPVFFLLLNGVFKATGVSVIAGRTLALVFGVAGIATTYELGRRFFSHPVGLVAAGLMAINIGHLFWCQSVRYYTLVLLLQLLCILWFLDGIQKGDTRRLIQSNIAFAVAMWTHFSALLLVPVLASYLVLALCLGKPWAMSPRRICTAFVIPFVIILGFFALQFLRFRELNLISGDGTPMDNQGPVALAVRLGAYFGVPVLGLGMLAPLLVHRRDVRCLVFFLIAAVVPVLELVVIARLELAVVAWYYIFFSLPAFAILAAATLVALFERGRRTLAATVGIMTIIYSGVFLVGYYTQMHGDRPRWQEATLHLAEVAQIPPTGATKVGRTQIYATVPGVVAYYLGVRPGETMGHPLVRYLPPEPPSDAAVADQWFVVERGSLPPQYADWLAAHCELRGVFEAWSGPKDRSVLVYQRTPRSADL